MRAHTVSVSIEDNISAIDSPQRCFARVTAGHPLQRAGSRTDYRGGHWNASQEETR
jgi:hypothetical protein